MRRVALGDHLSYIDQDNGGVMILEAGETWPRKIVSIENKDDFAYYFNWLSSMINKEHGWQVLQNQIGSSEELG